MPHSHHSHSGSFCRHAKGTLEEVVLEAISQGFTTFGLSEHAPRYRQEDLYPEESDLTPSDLETIYASFLEEAHRLRAVYSSKIALLVGIETDFITPRDLEGLSRLLERESARIDYIVGSLHHVNEIPIDFDKLTFDRALASLAEEGEDASSSMTRLLHTYLDSQHALLATVQPEVIGHFDLIRLYHPTLSLKAHPGVWAKVERNVRLGVEYGALFELNAAAFRKGWDEAYPAWDVLELIISLRGRLCLSDDSHGPLAVGLNYDRLHAYLRKRLVDELWFLELVPPPPTTTHGGGVEGYPRSGRVTPKRVEGKWWEDAFWTRRLAPAAGDA